jgi:xanthine dehydrogenase accessory factor
VILQQPLLERIIAEIEAGRQVALCAVVKTRGSTPQVPGALLVVDQAMKTEGTLGGGCVEAEVGKQAFQLLRAGRSELLTFQLDHDFGWDDGLICGGGMDVAVVPIRRNEEVAPFRRALKELAAGKPISLPLQVRRKEQPVEYRLNLEPEPTLLIAGAGHVGTALGKLAVELEFKVVVVDDRADFANAERLPPPIEPIAADIEQTLRDYPIDAATYVVVVTRGHNRDQQALSAVIDSPAKYVGMIGSSRKIKTIFDNLKAAGVEPELLQRVHSPIGVKINAVTVPEIAVSIAAELISVRRADRRDSVEGPLALSPGKSDEPS